MDAEKKGPRFDAGRLKTRSEIFCVEFHLFIDHNPVHPVHVFGPWPFYDGLPGSTRTEQALTEILDTGEALVVSRVDLVEFKSFNERAGFAAGDRTIQRSVTPSPA